MAENKWDDSLGLFHLSVQKSFFTSQNFEFVRRTFTSGEGGAGGGGAAAGGAGWPISIRG